jgi:uncharacterized membrane protein
MSLEKKLNLWKNNNLITTEQFDSILEYENKNSNSKLGIYTIITLGCVVLGLGIIALIASNWEEISDFLKLVIDFFILSILGLYIFRKYDNSNIRVKDSLIVVFILLIIGSIGLISQIYNTGGELYQAFLFWSIITLPIILFSESIFPSQFWIVSSFFVLNSYLEIFLRDKNPNLLITINILCIPNFFILLGLSLNYFNFNSLKKFSKSFYFWGCLIFLINTISVNFLSTDLELFTDSFKLIYSLYFIITILLFILTYKKDKKLSILYLAFIGLYFYEFLCSYSNRIHKIIECIIIYSFMVFNFFYLFKFKVS